MPLPLFAFTLLRNAIKYDYCYLESLKSLSHLVDKTFLALGNSEDDTESSLKEIPHLQIIPTIWDEKLRDGAIILSQQTNLALTAARNYAKKMSLNSAWAIYLQADEVLHQNDLELIKSDIENAENSGCDVVSFRYFHFWQNHNHIAINKKWYPQEIRAVRLFPRESSSPIIESWGDAQSFRNYSKNYFSEARIFHYGHVREISKYIEKKKDILQLYHEKNRLEKYRNREKKFDKRTEVLNYFGSHPFVMRERILRMSDIFELPSVDLVYIVGDENLYSSEFKKNILAGKTIWVSSVFKVPSQFLRSAVIATHSFLDRVMYPSKVPRRMRSKHALFWSKETCLTLKLSEKFIGLK